MPSSPLQITAALMSRSSKEHYVTAAALTASHAGPWQVPVATVSSGCAARAQDTREGGRNTCTLTVVESIGAKPQAR